MFRETIEKRTRAKGESTVILVDVTTWCTVTSDLLRLGQCFPNSSIVDRRVFSFLFFFFFLQICARVCHRSRGQQQKDEKKQYQFFFPPVQGRGRFGKQQLRVSRPVSHELVSLVLSLSPFHIAYLKNLSHAFFCLL